VCQPRIIASRLSKANAWPDCQSAGDKNIRSIAGGGSDVASKTQGKVYLTKLKTINNMSGLNQSCSSFALHRAVQMIIANEPETNKGRISGTELK
jgi:hypothetical protein